MTKRTQCDGHIPFIRIDCNDLLDAGFDGRICSNGDLQAIAVSLVDTYRERHLSQDLSLIAEELGVPRLSVKTAHDIIDEADARSVSYDTKIRFGEQYYTMMTKGNDYWLEGGLRSLNRVDLYIGNDMGLPTGTQFPHEFE